MPSSSSPQRPRLIGDVRFVPFHQLGGQAHVIVDGPATDGTVLGLSHWPSGGTPPELLADTSTEIVVRYLDSDPQGPEVTVISNNHFDEDGLFAAWMAVEQPSSSSLRARAIAAAEAGDFHTWTEPEHAQIALAAMAMAERPTTPFADVIRALNRARTHDPAGTIYTTLIRHVGKLIDDPHRYRLLWQEPWHAVERDRADIDDGTIRIEEVPGADIAIVRGPRRPHRLAVFPLTDAMRIIWSTDDGRLGLEHRYETWVAFSSRLRRPRVDLTPALAKLTKRDTLANDWRFDGIEVPQARLVPLDRHGQPCPSSLDADTLAAIVAEHSPTPVSS